MRGPASAGGVGARSGAERPRSPPPDRPTRVNSELTAALPKPSQRIGQVRRGFGGREVRPRAVHVPGCVAFGPLRGDHSHIGHAPAAGVVRAAEKDDAQRLGGGILYDVDVVRAPSHDVWPTRVGANDLLKEGILVPGCPERDDSPRAPTN